MKSDDIHLLLSLIFEWRSYYLQFSYNVWIKTKSKFSSLKKKLTLFSDSRRLWSPLLFWWSKFSTLTMSTISITLSNWSVRSCRLKSIIYNRKLTTSRKIVISHLMRPRFKRRSFLNTKRRLLRNSIKDCSLQKKKYKRQKLLTNSSQCLVLMIKDHTIRTGKKQTS